MADSFKTDSFAPAEPADSFQPEPSHPLSDLGAAFWEGTGGKAISDIVMGASRDPERVKKSVETAKAMLSGILTEPARVWQESRKTGEAMLNGDASGAAFHAAGMVPLLGAPAQQVGLDFANDHYATGFGHALGLVLPLAAGPLGERLGKPVASAAKTAVTETLGKTTGAGASAFRRAIDRPTPELTSAMRGQIGESDIVGHFQNALEDVKAARSAQYRADLAALPNSIQLDITPVQQSLDTALRSHNVRVNASGELDFSRSTISDASAQNAVRSVYNDVRDWGSQPGDLSPAGVDTLKRRIDDLYSPSNNSRALVQAVKDSTRRVLNNQVPGYSKMTKGYATVSEFLDKLKDLSLESKNEGTITRKLTTLLNQNNGYRQALVEQLGSFVGKDLEGELAGLALNRAAPRGLMGPGAGLGLLWGVAKGTMPASAALSIAMTSPRLMGELMVAMSKLHVPAGVGSAVKGTAMSTSAARLLELSGITPMSPAQPTLAPSPTGGR